MQYGHFTLSHIMHFSRVCVCVCVPTLPQKHPERYKLAPASLSFSLITPQSGGWSGPQASIVSTWATKSPQEEQQRQQAVHMAPQGALAMSVESHSHGHLCQSHVLLQQPRQAHLVHQLLSWKNLSVAELSS